jgi:acyl-coenzyme A synthetase/AMP-(fatty) acid ligase
VTGRHGDKLNFVATIVEGAERTRLAMVALGADGSRDEFTFGEVADRSGSLAARLSESGVRRGDIVLTLIGNRPEWVFSMLACFRMGAVVLPCNEQLRTKDLALRLSVTAPAAIVCDERNREQLLGAGPSAPVLFVPDEGLFAPVDTPHVDPLGLAAEDPALIVFTSGSTGEPKAVVHTQRYLFGQRLPGEHWLGVRPGDLVWCTAASGWSKSARNAYIAPWLQGGVALLHDTRFDPDERLDVLVREGVDVLCMSPTEYRVIAKRTEVRAPS